MDWNVLVIKLLGITNSSWVTVLRWGKGKLYLICALYHQAACRSSTSCSRDFAVWRISCVEFLLKMQCCYVSCTKWACVLSRNEIQEFVMGLDTTRLNITHHQSRRTKRSQAHLHNSLPFHSLQVHIIPPAALKMRMVLVMWQVNSHNSRGGHGPLNPEGE